ncbi:MAG: glycosyltransferase [Rhodocyclales bacterium]|nr:glycosyltransferase [Rhodocyclales bacterium]
MRVLMVSDVYFPRINGVSTSIETFVQRLAERGVEVTLIAPSYDAHVPAPHVLRVPSRRVPFDPEDHLMRYGELLRRAESLAGRGFDLVHVQTPFVAHYAGVKLGRALGVPVLATYHTLFEEYLHHYVPLLPKEWMRGLARRFSRSQCNALDAVVVPSTAMRERLRAYGVTVPMHILPTGIPVGHFSRGQRLPFRARWGIPMEAPVALFVGRVAHEKNLDFLLQAARIARRRMPELFWLITGEGPALASLKRKVRAMRLEDSVLFLGYLDRRRELPDAYAAADAFVFSSLTETQGLVLLEAMAAGLPVVALSAMGTADILGPRRGAVVPEHDPESFARDLVELLHEPERRRHLAGEARAYAGEWSDAAMAGRLADLYRELARA